MTATLVLALALGAGGWVKAAGGPQWDYADALVTLTNGNLAVAGGFERDGKSCVASVYRPDGSLLWSACDNDAGPTMDGFAAAAAPNGGLFVATRFKRCVRLPPLQNEICSGPLLRLDAEGGAQWVASESGGETLTRGVAALPDGGAVVVGWFERTHTFGEGAQAVSLRGSDWDAYVAAFDKAGKPRWARAMGGPNQDQATAVVSLEDGATVTTGWFREKAKFDKTLLNPKGKLDDGIFLLKLDADGKQLWVKSVASGEEAESHGLTRATDGGYFITGFYKKKLTVLGPKKPIVARRAGPKDEFAGDLFVLKTDAEGKVLWSLVGGGPRIDIGYGVAATADGGAVVTGTFEDTMQLGDDAKARLTSAGGRDVFVAFLDPAGKVVRLVRAGGQKDDEGKAVATGDGFVAVAGDFEGTASFFGDGEPAVTLNDATPPPHSCNCNDAFVMRWSP